MSPAGDWYCDLPWSVAERESRSNPTDSDDLHSAGCTLYKPLVRRLEIPAGRRRLATLEETSLEAPQSFTNCP